MAGVTTVRALTDPDWPAVLRIYAEAVDAGVATFEDDIPRPDVLDRRWLPGHRWVADVAGVVVGWAAASPVSTRSCLAGVAETTVHVAGPFRGRGIGRALLDRQVATADAAGLWTLQASIFPDDIAGLELHYATGFRLVGVRERLACYRGVWRDVALVERRRPD